MTEKQKEIIKAYACNKMRLNETGRKLNYHRNTICYHMEKVYKETGLDPRDFFDLVKLLRMIGEDV